MKELKSANPTLYITPEQAEPGQEEKNHKLLFCDDTDYLFKVGAWIKASRLCLKEYKEHFCVKLYKNKWTSMDTFKPTEMGLPLIVQKLDQQHERDTTDKTTAGISGEVSKQ